MNKASDYLIALDDGHGTNTAGKRTPNYSDGTYIKENEFNRRCIAFLNIALKRCGFRTLLVAPELEDTALKTRTDRANNVKASAFVSEHFNAMNSVWQTGASGTGVYYYPNSVNSKKLAGIVLKYLLLGTSQKSRGIIAKDFHVLRETYMVAILVENGFMDHKNEAELMLNESYQKEQAEQVCQGLCEYFNVVFVNEVKPTATIGNGNKTFIGTGAVNTNGLNVREYPNADSKILGQLVLNDKVWFAENTKGWLRIYTDKNGWINSTYVNIDKPIPIPEPVVVVVKPIPVIPTPPPTPIVEQIYRVRKSWEDVKGQIAAYEDLNNAKSRADSNTGYKVFDKDGNIVYTPIIIIPTPIPEIVPIPVPPIIIPVVITPDPIPVIVPIPIPEIGDADLKNMSISSILTKLLDMIKVLLEMLGKKN